jgi:hypothetical protein
MAAKGGRRRARGIGGGHVMRAVTPPRPARRQPSPAPPPAARLQSANGVTLVALGYAALFPDGYNARGIPGNFEGRVPHQDPAEDDDLCSPNYERPKDVVASLEYLATRPDIDLQRLALIAFSQGAQTGMNALLEASVDLGTYQVDYTDLVPDPLNPGEFIEQKIKKPSRRRFASPPTCPSRSSAPSTTAAAATTATTARPPPPSPVATCSTAAPPPSSSTAPATR